MWLVRFIEHGGQLFRFARRYAPDCHLLKDTVIAVYLEDGSTSEVLAHWVSWPETLNYLRFAPDLKVKVQGGCGKEVVPTTNAPAKGVVVSVPLAEGEDAVWDDNFIDLVPGEGVRIEVQELDRRTVKARWL